MTRAEMRRQRARKRRRKIAVNIARVAVVALIAGTVLIGATKYDSGEQEPATASEVVFRSEDKDKYFVLTLPAAAGELEDAESVLAETPEAQEDYENEKIEAALLEQGYLSDEIPLDYDTQACLRAWCEEYSVPYQIALAVIEAESTFNPEASNGSCYGYMQINSINLGWLGEEIGVTDLTDPLQNLHSGVFLLGHLYEKYGDWHKALTCYNFGESGAQEYVFSQGLTSSRYSWHVMELYEKWAEAVK